jgi:SlyX protein
MTDRTNSAEARIEALEMRLAYQDDTLDKLNAAITDQWTQIDVLTRQVAELRDRLREAESRAPAAPGHEPPPHY